MKFQRIASAVLAATLGLSAVPSFADGNDRRDSNREEILRQSEAFRGALEELERQMRDWNGPALEALIDAASASRSQWQLNPKSTFSRL